MLYVGIDVGLKGGLGFINHEQEYWVMPMTDITSFYKTMRLYQQEYDGKIHVFIEKAQAMPRQGVASVFNYGKHAGYLEGVLVALEISYTLVPPQEWQKEMFTGIPHKIANPKEKAALAAERLFPREDFLSTTRCTKKHDGMIDAMHIAEYCRRKIG